MVCQPSCGLLGVSPRRGPLSASSSQTSCRSSISCNRPATYPVVKLSVCLVFSIVVIKQLWIRPNFLIGVFSRSEVMSILLGVDWKMLRRVWLVTWSNHWPLVSLGEYMIWRHYLLSDHDEELRDCSEFVGPAWYSISSLVSMSRSLLSALYPDLCFRFLPWAHGGLAKSKNSWGKGHKQNGKSLARLTKNISENCYNIFHFPPLDRF